jgi:hypothetical protein
MSLPGKEVGTITENNGRATTIADGFYNYFVVNNNIKDNPVKVDLATKFIQYCYEDASLQNSTMLSGMPCGLEYELTTAQYDSMETYKQSLWDIYTAGVKNGTYLSPVGSSKVFYNNFNQFAITKDGTYYEAVIGGMKYTMPRSVFNLAKNNTAKDYFEGMKITQTQWNNYK